MHRKREMMIVFHWLALRCLVVGFLLKPSLCFLRSLCLQTIIKYVHTVVYVLCPPNYGGVMQPD